VTVQISNASVREILAGIYVGNTLHAALPQSATTTIYTITGGRILLVALLAEVTTAIQAQATTFKFTSSPATGSAIDFNAAAGTDLTGLQIGGRVTLANPPASGTAGIITNAGYTNLQPLNSVVPIGNITVTTVASSTGGLKYDLIYIPLDVASTVVAA
jgi:hypothetical protein